MVSADRADRRAAPAHRPPAFLTPLLYEKGHDGRARGATAFTDITKGNNASPQPGVGYHAREGYDAVSGWGVPNGRALLELARVVSSGPGSKAGQQSLGSPERRQRAELLQNRGRVLQHRSGFVGAPVVEQHGRRGRSGPRASQYG